VTTHIPQTDSLNAACIAEVTLPAEAVFFADTMATFPAFAGSLWPYRTNAGSVQSVLCMNSGEQTVIGRDATGDSTVNSVHHMNSANGRHLYDLSTTFTEASPFYTATADQLTILTAAGQGDTWTVLFWASSPAVVEACQRAVGDSGLDWDIQNLYRSQSRSHNPLTALTPVQRETMTTAFELGYFDIPRTVSMQELSEELGVTPNAVSERVRRAEAKLLGELLSESSAGYETR
jgi:predicted DNA binding protein